MLLSENQGLDPNQSIFESTLKGKCRVYEMYFSQEKVSSPKIQPPAERRENYEQVAVLKGQKDVTSQ